MKSLKEELDEYTGWDDPIEYDDFGDGNVEGTGNLPEDSDDTTVSGPDNDASELASQWFAHIGAENTDNLDGFSMDDEPEDDEEDENDEAGHWLSAHESLESLNAKEAKLREALRAVRNAKLKLNK